MPSESGIKEMAEIRIDKSRITAEIRFISLRFMGSPPPINDILEISYR
jgi:hypothetical protein